MSWKKSWEETFPLYIKRERRGGEGEISLCRFFELEYGLRHLDDRKKTYQNWCFPFIMYVSAVVTISSNNMFYIIETQSIIYFPKYSQLNFYHLSKIAKPDHTIYTVKIILLSWFMTHLLLYTSESCMFPPPLFPKTWKLHYFSSDFQKNESAFFFQKLPNLKNIVKVNITNSLFTSHNEKPVDM